ncbi:MAG TPA: DUF6075 family protein [Bacillota bacterium]
MKNPAPYGLFDCGFAPDFSEAIRPRYPEYCRNMQSVRMCSATPPQDCRNWWRILEHCRLAEAIRNTFLQTGRVVKSPVGAFTILPVFLEGKTLGTYAGPKHVK